MRHEVGGNQFPIQVMILKKTHMEYEQEELNLESYDFEKSISLLCGICEYDNLVRFKGSSRPSKIALWYWLIRRIMCSKKKMTESY